MPTPRILVADHQRSDPLTVAETLRNAGNDVVEAKDGLEARERLRRESFDLLLADVRIPGLDGPSLIEEAQRAAPPVEVVLMTGLGSVRDAVEAINRGAFDYLTRPIEPDALLAVVRRAIERRNARQLSEVRDAHPRFGNLVGRSAPMTRLFKLMSHAARTNVTVLITGETGTGKELVARGIHDESARRDGPFVAVNCGAMPTDLLEAELFGCEAGAFTDATGYRVGFFEGADGGTLFLDEIGDLPMPLQVKLNRVIQERAVRPLGGVRERAFDVRIIAATNNNLQAEVERGRFRQDLYYRLNVFAIETPPLRDRREDVALLGAAFLERHGDGRLRGFSNEAVDELVRRDWKGNVRELENAVRRAVALAAPPRIELRDLQRPEATRATHQRTADLTFHEILALTTDRASRTYLAGLMRECRGNIAVAAERAGMRTESLYRLLKKHGVPKQHAV